MPAQYAVFENMKGLQFIYEGGPYF